MVGAGALAKGVGIVGTGSGGGASICSVLAEGAGIGGGVALATMVGTGGGAVGTDTCCVAALEGEDKSTTRSEPVNFLACDGGTVPGMTPEGGRGGGAPVGAAEAGVMGGGVSRAEGGRSGTVVVGLTDEGVSFAVAGLKEGGRIGARPVDDRPPVGGFVTAESAWVEGSEGGRDWCGIGSTLGGFSTLPLCTKTFAFGLATMTRGGGTTSRPEGDANSPGDTEPVLPGGGCCGLVGRPGAGGTSCDCGGLGGKSGFVFDVGGAPVRGGAAGLAWEVGGGVGWLGVFVMVGIGLVTAVDQAGGAPVEGAGSSCCDAILIGSVVAAETLGRGAAGEIFAEAGFSGRGGRLIRRVSRLGAFGS